MLYPTRCDWFQLFAPSVGIPASTGRISNETGTNPTIQLDQYQDNQPNWIMPRNCSSGFNASTHRALGKATRSPVLKAMIQGMTDDGMTCQNCRSRVSCVSCVTVSALQTSNAGRRDKTKFTSKTKQKELCRQDLYMPRVSEAQNDEKWKILWKWHRWINEYDEYDASQRKKPKPRANVFKLSYSVTPHVYSTDLQDFQDRFDMVRLAWDPRNSQETQTSNESNCK